MDYTNTDQINEYLKQHLTEKRYRHSLGVQKMAVQLAEIYGEDVVKANFAGLTHDIAKCYPVEQLNRLIREYGVSEDYYNNPALAHSKVGVAILQKEFGVDDPDILAAVSSHTTGRNRMSMLEEIIYVSDAIEPNRSYDGVFRLRQLVKFDIDEVCLEILEFCIRNLRFQKRKIDRDTLEAYEFIQNKIQQSEES